MVPHPNVAPFATLGWDSPAVSCVDERKHDERKNDELRNDERLIWPNLTIRSKNPAWSASCCLVFALTFLVIILFQPLLKKYGPQPPAKPETTQAQPNPAPAPQQSQPSPAPPASATSAASDKAAPAATPLQATAESDTVIENDVYRIVFTNRGARVKSWILKKYTDDKGGQLELVNAAAAEKYGYPLTLWSYDEALRDKLNSALYVATSTGATAPAEITFNYAAADVS